MKTPTILISLIVAATPAAVLVAQTALQVPPAAPVEAVSEKAAAVGMLPHQKQGKALELKERNPFAEEVRVESKGEVEDANSEEGKIRAVLMGMAISGKAMGGAGQTKVQLGGLILEEGRELPQLIPNQTDILKVTKITEKTVEISWLDVEGSEQPRKHVIQLEDPTMRKLLPSPGGEGEGGTLSQVDPRAEEKRALKRSELTSRNETPSPAE